MASQSAVRVSIAGWVFLITLNNARCCSGSVVVLKLVLTHCPSAVCTAAIAFAVIVLERIGPDRIRAAHRRLSMIPCPCGRYGGEKWVGCIRLNCAHAPWRLSRRATRTPRRLCVSIKFVNDMVRLQRATGSLAPKPQGNSGRGKLICVEGWVERRIAAQPDLPIDEPTVELGSEHGLKVHRSSVRRLLLRLGLSHKKDLQALDKKSMAVAELRHNRITKRQPFMASHLESMASIPSRQIAAQSPPGNGRNLSQDQHGQNHGPGPAWAAPG